jgi:hypothetical protein
VRRTAGLLGVLTLLAGCGSGAAAPPPEATTSAPVLAASAAPALRSTARRLDAGALAIATPVPGLRDRLTGWGLRGAAEREFTGTDRDLSHIVARTVDFRSGTGARAYGRAIVAGAASYLGTGSSSTPLQAGGRSGWFVRASGCGCRPEPPTVVAVLRDGPRVSWLSITGTGATRGRLVRMAGSLP